MFESSTASGSKLSGSAGGPKCSRSKGSHEKARQTLLKACGRMDTGVFGASPQKSGCGFASTKDKRNSLGIRTSK